MKRRSVLNANVISHHAKKSNGGRQVLALIGFCLGLATCPNSIYRKGNLVDCVANKTTGDAQLRTLCLLDMLDSNSPSSEGNRDGPGWQQNKIAIESSALLVIKHSTTDCSSAC